MNKITTYLNQHIVGNVFEKASILEPYAFDRSVYKIMPRFVALPESTQDVRKLVRFVDQLAMKNFHLPIAVRGSGLDKTGADLTSGIVISTEKLNHIQEIDAHDRLVRVQAGVTLGQLNTALSLHGLTLPICADPRETIGSLIANCPVDDYSAKYGGITKFVNRVEFVLANGEIIQTAKLRKRALDKKKGLTNSEGVLYRNLGNLLNDYADAIGFIANNNFDNAGYPNIVRVYRQKNKTFDILPLLYGSQGTLGIITEVILECDVIPTENKHLIASFGSVKTAMEFLNLARFLKPAELNMYDTRIITAVEESGKRPELLTRKLDEVGGFIVVVGFDDSPRKNHKKIQKCIAALPKSANPIVETSENSAAFGDIHSALISYLNDITKGERVPVADDFYVPVSEFASFMEDITALETELKRPLHLYGSYNSGNFNIRPDINLSTEEGRQFAFDFAKKIDELLVKHHGSFTGGMPEGRSKAFVAERYTDRQKKLYEAIKATFDPYNIYGSDCKINADKSDLKHVRTEPGNHIVL